MTELSSLFRIDDDVAVVTGGASGIGEATAHVLVEAGAAVVIGDIDEEGGALVAKQLREEGGQAISMRADTSKRADVEALVDRAVAEFGRLDVMCNIAGIGHTGPFIDIADDELERLLAVNVKGVVYGCQAAIRAMADHGGGVIVNVSSTAIDVPGAGMSLYGMTKAAVAYLSQVLGEEAGRQGIRVNAIAPGATPTNFARHRYADGQIDVEQEKELAEMVAALTPLGFLGQALDQALLILYLASPAGRWANGNIWRLNGGQSRVW